MAHAQLEDWTEHLQDNACSLTVEELGPEEIGIDTLKFAMHGSVPDNFQ